MSDNRAAKEPSARLEELKQQVERATALIGELRERNYSLTTEVVELKNRLTAGVGETSSGESSDSGSEEAPEPAAVVAEDTGLAEEVELLRSERETVRKKLKGLIARIENLES